MSKFRAFVNRLPSLVLGAVFVLVFVITGLVIMSIL